MWRFFEMEHKKNDKEMKTALVLLLPIFIFTMLAIVGFTVAGYFAFLFLGSVLTMIFTNIGGEER
jgi:hypothetical protein